MWVKFQKFGLLLFWPYFFFVQLSEEIQQMMELDGMRRRDHVLEFARLMVRAESVEHRVDLLKVLQVGQV